SNLLNRARVAWAGTCHPREISRSADAPEPAQAIEGDFHALGGRGVGIHAVAPAQGVSHLLERDFAADRAVEHVGADLADRRHRFAEALAREIERAEVVVQAAKVPVMAIFLRGGVLLGGDGLAREGPLQRAVAHGDLTGITAFE